MSSDLADRGSFSSIVIEKCEDKVFELQRQVCGVRLLEIEVGLFGANEVVEVLFLSSLFKRKDALHDDEENHTEGKHVSLDAVVCLALFDLRCHVGEGTAIATEAVELFVTCEPKVSKFQLQVVVNQNVFEFQVSVSNSVAVHVLHRVEHLMSKEPTHVFAHRTHELANVEQ